MKRNIVYIGMLLTLMLFCGNPVDQRYGSLIVSLRWPADSGFVSGVPSPVSRIRFVLQPCSLVQDISPADTPYTMNAELGIYNVSVTALRQDSIVLYIADTLEVLVQYDSTTAISLSMDATLYARGPRFAGISPVNNDADGLYTLRWTSVPGATAYRLEEDTDTAFSHPAALFSGADTSFNVAGKTNGAYYYRVRAENADTVSLWSPRVAFNVNIPPKLYIVTNMLPGGTENISYTATIHASGGTPPYAWNIGAGALPHGLDTTIDTCLHIAGVPDSADTFMFTVQVADSGTPVQTASKTYTVIIARAGQPVVITTDSLPYGVIGINYNAGISAAGGTPPYSWRILSGAIPGGLDTSNIGYLSLSGIPEKIGTFSFSVEVSDSGSPATKDTGNFSILIRPGGVTIITAKLDTGYTGVVYADSIAVQGGSGTFLWSKSGGTLPDGLILDTTSTDTSAAVQGIPTKAGTFTFTVKATDSLFNDLFDTATFSIVIQPQALQINTLSLPPCTVGISLDTAIHASGGTVPYRWSITAGSLPAGIDTATSGTRLRIFGTPAAVDTADFTAQVADAGTPQQTQSRSFRITINPTPLQIATDSLPACTVGVSIDTAIHASGGTMPYQWSITAGSLPAGIDTASTGSRLRIFGTPAAVDTADFTVQVADASSPQQTQSRSFRITINPTPLQIATDSLPSCTVGVSIDTAIHASGGTMPYQWSIIAGSLPAGIDTASTGSRLRISGTPSAVDTADFTVQTADAGSPHQIKTKSFRIIVNPPLLQITTIILPSCTAGVSIDTAVHASGGTLPYAWSITSGSLPAGIDTTWSASRLRISGTPTTADTATFTVQVSDAGSPQQVRSRAFELTVYPAPVKDTTPTPLPEGAIYRNYSPGVRFYASGGSGSYTWIKISGNLPPGLIVEYIDNTYYGIRGIPTDTGSYSFTMRVVDNVYPQISDTTDYTIIVRALLAILPDSLPEMNVGEAYDTCVCARYGTPPFHWELAGGQLPPGIDLDSTAFVNDTCLRMFGMPTPAAFGSWSITLRVTGSGGPADTASKYYSITVGRNPITIITDTLPMDTAGQFYDARLHATGGSGSWEWVKTGGTLLPDLVFTADFGDGVARISGIPKDSGVCTVTVAVTDIIFPTLSDTATYIIRIRPPFHIVTAALPVAFVSASYDTGIVATNGVVPFSWNILSGSLPQGMDTISADVNRTRLNFDQQPIMSGTWNIQFEAVDADIPEHRDTASYTIIVLDSLKITTSNAVPDTHFVATSFIKSFQATGGSGSRTWSIEHNFPRDPLLYQDVNGDNASIDILTQMGEEGTYTYTMIVTDAAHATVTARKTFIVVIK